MEIHKLNNNDIFNIDAIPLCNLLPLVIKSYELHVCIQAALYCTEHISAILNAC